MELMHLTDCHGVSAIVYGGILGLILEERHLGRTQSDRLTFVNEFMSTWYAKHPGANRLPRLRRNNLLNDGWWELSGQVIKAAAMRSAPPLFAELANATLVGDNPRAAQAPRLAELFDTFYTAVYAARLFPSDTDIGKVRAIINEFGEVIMSLRADSMQRNKLYFKITPKVHKLMHVPMYMEVMNPRWLQAYLEEGLIGSFTKIWQRGVKWRYERQIQSNVLLRRYLGLLLRLEL